MWLRRNHAEDKSVCEVLMERGWEGVGEAEVSQLPRCRAVLSEQLHRHRLRPGPPPPLPRPHRSAAALALPGLPPSRTRAAAPSAPSAPPTYRPPARFPGITTCAAPLECRHRRTDDRPALAPHRQRRAHVERCPRHRLLYLLERLQQLRKVASLVDDLRAAALAQQNVTRRVHPPCHPQHAHPPPSPRS